MSYHELNSQSEQSEDVNIVNYHYQIGRRTITNIKNKTIVIDGYYEVQAITKNIAKRG